MHAEWRRWRVVLVFLLVVMVWLAVPVEADAHVKWFCGIIDLRAPPKALHAVLSPTFFERVSVFLSLVIIGGAVDSLISQRWPILESGSPRFDFLEEIVVRLCLIGYMLGLSAGIAVVPWSPLGDGAILTPDLFDADHLVSLAQVLIALTLVFRRTCFLAGFGVAGLYGFGILRYGMFHMTDYVFFLGLAAYLILGFPRFDRQPSLRRWRVPVLVGSLSFSLMWTAIEKFLYPGWTDIVLALYPSIGMGFPTPFVTLTAGFVEFTLAFYLLVGHSLLRPGAFLFMSIFIVAIPEFGVLDGVGHLPIIAIFLVAIIHGVSRLQHVVRPRGTRALRTAATVASLYIGILVTGTAMYYGMQKTTWW
jgi:hypothetical protein